MSVGGDKTVFLWDVATAKTLRRFGGHLARVNACAFGGEGGSVVVSGEFLRWRLKALEEEEEEGWVLVTRAAMRIGREIFLKRWDGC